MNTPLESSYKPNSKDREVSDHKLDTELRTRLKAGYTRYEPCPVLYYTGEVELTPKGEILGVWCMYDEDIEWLWNDDNVYGYNIIKHHS